MKITIIGSGFLYRNVPLAWRLAAVNLNGTVDLIFKNTQTGDVSFWTLTRSSRTPEACPPQRSNAGRSSGAPPVPSAT